jgi:hypothetical protein
VRYRRVLSLVFSLLCWGSLMCGQKATGSAFVSTNSSVGVNSANAPFIVIGFVGGFVRHDDTVHSPVQVAERIRKDCRSSVYIKVFENHRREQAHQVILKLLDTNLDGTRSDEEKRNARIILYGMSWGGSETVALARELQTEKIPVLLTIQVDSVEKMRENDEVIPANVTEAVNFYESDGFVHGRSEIRAEGIVLATRGHRRIAEMKVGHNLRTRRIQRRWSSLGRCRFRRRRVGASSNPGGTPALFPVVAVTFYTGEDCRAS